MITSAEIEQKAHDFGINPAEVEKDYVYGWILYALFTQSALSNQLILKGGNGLRKAYLLDTRFSKDLDFSCHEHLDQTILANQFSFTKNPSWTGCSQQFPCGPRPQS